MDIPPRTLPQNISTSLCFKWVMIVQRIWSQRGAIIEKPSARKRAEPVWGSSDHGRTQNGHIGDRAPQGEEIQPDTIPQHCPTLSWSAISALFLCVPWTARQNIVSAPVANIVSYSHGNRVNFLFWPERRPLAAMVKGGPACSVSGFSSPFPRSSLLWRNTVADPKLDRVSIQLTHRIKLSRASPYLD